MSLQIECCMDLAPLCRFARPQRLIRNTGAVTSLSAVAHSFLTFGIARVPAPLARL